MPGSLAAEGEGRGWLHRGGTKDSSRNTRWGRCPRVPAPQLLSSVPPSLLIHVSEGRQTRKVRNVPLPPPSPRPGLSGVPGCHYTTRDLRARLVLQEASRGVLIKGHNKIDLPAHQKKCPPGK